MLPRSSGSFYKIAVLRFFLEKKKKGMFFHLKLKFLITKASCISNYQQTHSEMYMIFPNFQQKKVFFLLLYYFINNSTM